MSGRQEKKWRRAARKHLEIVMNEPATAARVAESIEREQARRETPSVTASLVYLAVVVALFVLAAGIIWAGE